ncbi:SDR family oxidoreductase [Mycolicibacterium pallens]|uniref:SDR family oxidoreductase n=1 Tax=Mycolicibacterium pallens TaxID=370524 RepID=A0ABX8VH86_9MYCO|nr:SDR family oxidoreductase [Mycolicibacterium pallens]QYL17147.1 SDR family oxidoreductase [Mycolicibacterium pallens]
MKITVLGATGLIGSRVVTLLRAAGHEVTPAARSAGVDAVTGKGLDGALAGADVVVDVTNAPSLDAEPVMTFFTAESANLVAAAKAAAVNHIVVLSIVGVDALPDSGYAGAKVVQEKTVIGSGVPYTIVRATQFHEFTERIVGSLLVDGTYRVPDARIQPISAAEVAAVVADAAQAAPVNGVLDVGGPEKMTFGQLVRVVSAVRGRQAPIVVDSAATYFGTPVDQHSLVTGHGAVITDTTLTDWLAAE